MPNPTPENGGSGCGVEITDVDPDGMGGPACGTGCLCEGCAENLRIAITGLRELLTEALPLIPPDAPLRWYKNDKVRDQIQAVLAGRAPAASPAPATEAREAGRKAGLTEAAGLIRQRLATLEFYAGYPSGAIRPKPGTIEVLREALEMVEGRLTVTEAEAAEFGKSVAMDAKASKETTT